jgi:hypothetical protein
MRVIVICPGRLTISQEGEPYRTAEHGETVEISEELAKFLIGRSQAKPAEMSTMAQPRPNPKPQVPKPPPPPLPPEPKPAMSRSSRSSKSMRRRPW